MLIMTEAVNLPKIKKLHLGDGITLRKGVTVRLDIGPSYSDYPQFPVAVVFVGDSEVQGINFSGMGGFVASSLPDGIIDIASHLTECNSISRAVSMALSDFLSSHAKLTVLCGTRGIAHTIELTLDICDGRFCRNMYFFRVDHRDAWVERFFDLPLPIGNAPLA